MADAAVDFLLENLHNLQIYHSHLINKAKHRFEKLESNLRLFKAFLKDSVKKRREDEGLRDLASEIRDVVYEAEDIIDALVTQAADSNTRSYFRRAFDTKVKFLNVVKDMETIGAKVIEAYGNNTWIDFADSDGDGGPEESEVPRDNELDFEDGAKELIEYLLEETQYLDVISIIGMPSLGKTTLAKKIFHNQAIQYGFTVCIWVYVSQEFTKKGVFLAILKELTTIDENMYRKSDQELAELVATHLERQKFFIVMDDVRTVDDWNKLQIALPKSNNDGKVLITSRHVEVAQFANRDRLPHHLHPLTQDESWSRLQYEVFGKAGCPPELEVIGKLIAQQCCRIPLAIALIGGILGKTFKASNDMKATTSAWTEVFESVNAHLNEDSERRMEKIIRLSHDKLPYNLRSCFLYLAMFPEDFEIPVWKLIRMWIAQVFIQKRPGISLEETAENYLQDLIRRNLLRVDKMRSDNEVKTCRIHHMLRKFCKKEARSERENFLQEVKRNTEGLLIEPSVSDLEKIRHLCIHSDVLNFLSSQPFGPRVRSFVCFSKDTVTLAGQDISSIPAGFKLLRVLEAMPTKFARLPGELLHLYHLRYITLSFNLAFLPESFSNFWNLQTLVIYTTSRAFDIKADIWNMTQLRDLKTNAPATLPKTGESSKAGAKFQTLGRISPHSCTKEVLERAHNLKKLAISGQLAWLLDGRSFDNMMKLERLVKLKLENEVYPNPPSRRQLRGLPPSYKFPPNLKSLTLAYTFLDWSHMSILGLLDNLKVLKVKDRAFMGTCWEVAGRFRSLEFLHIAGTNLVTWVALGYQFPRLRRLELAICDELVEIPIGLVDAPNFQELDLCHAELAIASAKKIQEAKQRMQEGESSRFGGFKLSIFPPEE
ncbi:putative late blight resistance proteinR1C-3 [Sesamum alatum]|uniref:Late blight resistance proteinR1C-3 n=1 Tax=Sesamum alatum TaxID=300844 RepID=A0AAE1YDP6_9LAMI|nr:putative late blight resistance proteinR1C-3 [Sesamum alatum]